MEPSGKLFLKGTLTLLLGIVFLLWGYSDILSLTNDPTIALIIILSIMIPLVIIVIVFVIMITVKVTCEKHKLFFLNEKNWIYNCVECGAPLRLEEKACSKCGVENAKRKDALERLEIWEQSIEKERAKILKKHESSKRRGSDQDRSMLFMEKLKLDQQITEAKLMRKRLLIGNTRDEKLE